MASFQNLGSSHKAAYPFRLAAPSYIYPADWCTNVNLLGPYVDEIELLFLESHPESCFPTQVEMDQLLALGKTHSLTFNIHLPSDISLSDPMASRRKEAVDALRRVIALTAPLTPSTWTLHLPFDREAATPEAIIEWQNCNREGLAALLDGTGISAGRLSIETLFYPFEWIGDVVRSLNLSICLDTGHLMIKGVDVGRLYAEYADIISILHVHGVCRHRVAEHGAYQHGGRDPDESRLIDHQSMDRFSPERAGAILALLRQFKGVVSLEVFSFSQLSASMEWLSDQWQRLSPSPPPASAIS
jgi:sugar phosphate isomerase/epimerase